MKLALALVWAIYLSLVPRYALAQTRVPERIAVLTMSPGDHPFARFGHNAILVEWSRRRALVYNFGTFAFDGMDGVRDFMAGRFRYWLSVSTLSSTLRAYAAQNRSVVAQYLDLDANQRLGLGRALEENARPENRYYDYDYFYDNCSTRVRDVLDRALGGELARQTPGPGRQSFREHALRLTADVPWLYFGLDLALGRPTDRDITRWNELFIPGELEQALAGARYLTYHGPKPLVSETRRLQDADRGPVRADPPARVGGCAFAGMLSGALLAALGRKGASSRVARAGFAACAALLGLLLGLLGTVFAFFWVFTKHWAAHQNFNLLTCTPYAIVLAIGAFGLGARDSRLARASYGVIALAAVTSLVAVLAAIALGPPIGQDSARITALLAPVWFGLFAGADGLLERRWLERASQSIALRLRQSRTTS